jgi:hypothetical protein
MRRFFAVSALVVGFGMFAATPAFAADPHTGGSPGQPGQSCQSFSATTRPGLSYLSPGSPFNEPDNVNSANGGVGGAHYSETSQYDVACFQVSLH